MVDERPVDWDAVSSPSTKPGGTVSSPTTEPATFGEGLQAREQTMREGTVKRILWVFLGANVLALVLLAILVWLDQCNIAAKLIGPKDRIVTNQVIMTLLGATTVQVGAIMGIITRYLFPSRSNEHTQVTGARRRASGDRGSGTS
jgi:hypothetical protein